MSVKQFLLALSFLFLPSNISAQTLYTQPCPILNLNYPALSSYASSSVVQSAMAALNSTITSSLGTTTVYGQLENSTDAFVIDIYSLGDEESLFTYNFTPSQLVAQHQVGVETANTDSIFRIASISKVLTVYLYLTAAGDETWNSPVTNFVPELAAYSQMYQSALETDQIDYVDWRSITVGALASQLSGIAREDDYSSAFEQELQQEFDLPPATRNASAFCGDPTFSLACNRQGFFDDFLKQHPFTAPFTTAIYSNIAIQIFAYAVENITGKALSDLFEENFNQKLGLTNTYYSLPPTTNTSYIPFNASLSLWNLNARDETPTGGYYTSAADMRRIGKSIFNYTLISGAQTRRWMKPHSFTSDPNFAVGAPWEIVRGPGEPVNWIYAKSGNLGAYSSEIGLIPEYKVGFTVFVAGSTSGSTALILSDIVSAAVVPAVFNASKANAQTVYAGTYTNSTANSSITIATPETGSGLIITDWTQNGTSVLTQLAGLYGLNTTTQYEFNATLSPSGLTSNGGTVVSWRAQYRLFIPLDPGSFSENCISWGSANIFTYSGVGLDEFLFTLGDNGNAVSIEPRVKMLELMRGNGTTLSRSMRRSI